MKNLLLSVLCILIASTIHAQSTFGIMRYTLPEGWDVRKSGSDVVLKKSGAENSSCTITLFQISGVVSSEKDYAELWASKTKNGNSGIQKTTPTKTEGDGWISFSGGSTTGKGAEAYTEGFYTLSDGNKTTILILAQAASGNSCIDEMDSILASMHIPEKESNTKTKAKRKGVRGLPLKSLKAFVN